MEMSTIVIPVFKDLKKDTIGQSYATLNRLLKGKSSNDVANLHEILTKNELPKFEESLRLIIIDLLRLEKEVLKILLSQDNYKIKRILNCNWFFQKSLTVEDYIKNVFPYVSLSLRSKLVTKLSDNLLCEDDAEKLFTYFYQHYSIPLAEFFLPKCSNKFVLNYLCEVKPCFQYNNSCRILLKISQRNPKTGLLILSSLAERNLDLESHNKVIRFLAETHLDLFIPFFENNFSKLRFLQFGRSLSRKFGLKVIKLLLKEKPFLNSSVIRKPFLFKALDAQNQLQFLVSEVTFAEDKLTFKNWENSNFNIIQYLKLIKPDKRLEMVEAVFKMLYNSNYKEYSKLWKPEVLELLPLNLREPFVKILEESLEEEPMEDDTSENWVPPYEPENIVYLYGYDVGFKKLRALLAKAPNVNQREDIIRYMVKNCAINQDVSHLKDLIEYVSGRVRNDDPHVLIEFLQFILNSFPLKFLSLDIIVKLEETIQLCFVKGSKNFYVSLMLKCIMFRLNANMDADSQIRNVVRCSISQRDYWQSFVPNCKSSQSRKFFFKFYHEIYLWMKENPKDTERLKHLPLWIARTVAAFNKCNKKNPILLTDLPELQESFKGILQNQFKNIFDDVDMLSVLEYHRFDILSCNFIPFWIRYIIKRCPILISTHVTGFLNHLFSSLYKDHSVMFPQYVKVFSFLGVLDQVKAITTATFHNEKDEGKQINALAMLPFVCDIKEFESVIKEYIPSRERIDAETNIEFTRIQLNIPKHIKYAVPSWKNLDLVFRFFIGDFIKYVLTSFNKCCYNTRIDVLVPTLMAYLDRIAHDLRISIRKEVIRVLIVSLTRKESVDMCLQFWDTINHYSIRTLLLKRLSTVFLEQPSPEVFEILSKFIRESDELIIEARFDIDRAPTEYFSDYVSSLWSFSKNQIPKFRKDFQNSILQSLKPSYIARLKNDICKEIIATNLFKSSGLNVNNFAVNYLICEPSNCNERIELILEVIKNATLTVKSVSEFLITLRRNSFRNFELFAKILDIFLSKWINQSTPVLYEQKLILHYYQIYLKEHNRIDDITVKDRSLNFGKELLKFYSNVVHIDNIVGVLAETLKTFFIELRQHNQALNPIFVCKELLSDNQNTSMAILVILAIPNDFSQLYRLEDQTFDSKDAEKIKELNEIVEVLKSHQSYPVQMYFRKIFGYRKSEYSLIKIV